MGKFINATTLSTNIQCPVELRKNVNSLTDQYCRRKSGNEREIGN